MKRRLRFTLKTFLLTSVVLSAIFAVAYQYSTYPQRRWQAVQNSLRAIGKGEIEGAVLYDPTFDEHGEWSVGNLLELHFEGTNVADSDLQHVRVLDPQELLNLAGTEITDSGLQHLHGLRVKKIVLTGTDTTAKGIGSLTKSMDDDIEIVKSN